MQGEALKGHLDLLILSVVEHAPLHGYGIIVELNRRSEGLFELKEGTIYPALHRLERARLLRSRWEKGDGPRPRRLYSLTPEGRKALAQRGEEWHSFASAMNRVLDPRWQS
ncbi:MAG: PadR family transcriptional regulator [Thermoleophilia bacterium]